MKKLESSTAVVQPAQGAFHIMKFKRVVKVFATLCASEIKILQLTVIQDWKCHFRWLHWASCSQLEGCPSICRDRLHPDTWYYFHRNLHSFSFHYFSLMVRVAHLSSPNSIAISWLYIGMVWSSYSIFYFRWCFFMQLQIVQGCGIAWKMFFMFVSLTCSVLFTDESVH